MKIELLKELLYDIDRNRNNSDKVHKLILDYSKIYQTEKTTNEIDFIDFIDWRKISYQTLSEDFIREFTDKVDWIEISCKQKLSEDFIREFTDKVNWTEISCNQKEDFIREPQYIVF